MMKISLFSKGSGVFKGGQTAVSGVASHDSITSLAEDIEVWAWSPILYKDSYRHGSNFLEAHVAVLDIDNDGESTLSLDEAMKLFAPYKHIIATTRSHQVEKNGRTVDRYRVIIPFDGKVSDPDTYRQVMLSLRSKWSFMDPKCVDLARFFFPCDHLMSAKDSGDSLIVSELSKPFVSAKEPAVSHSKPVALKDQLTRPTLRFLLEGAEPGQWHGTFFKAVSNMKECGYEIEETTEKLEAMCSLIGSPGLDETDLRQIQNIYDRPTPDSVRKFYDSWAQIDSPAQEQVASDEPAVILYPADGFSEFSSYITDEVKSKGTPTGIDGLDKMLGGGFRTGELTVLMAEAKTGKNTLFHFMIWNMLAQKIKQGYASREIDPFREVVPNLLSLEFSHNVWTIKKDQKLLTSYEEKLKGWKDLMFSQGYGYFAFEELAKWMHACVEMGAKNFWLDHLHYMLSESEDFKEASRLMKNIKTLAKQLDVHINLIVQPTKMMQGQALSLNTLRGGAAIGQALDNLLILERHKDTADRFISKLKLEVGRHKLTKPGEIFLKYEPKDCSFIEVEKEEAPQHAQEHAVDPFASVDSYVKEVKKFSYRQEN